VLNGIDLDAVISGLHQELDLIDQAILTLEGMAIAYPRGNGLRTVRRSAARVRVVKRRAIHRLRSGRAD
jgi:hypothetical protein